jgi:hypothetical protein
MDGESNLWKRLWHGVRRILRGASVFLSLLWIFLPGILLIGLAGFGLTGLLQGQDVVLIALEHRWRGLFLLTGLVFWAGVTWYSSSLIGYNHDRLFKIFPLGLYHGPRLLGFLCFTVLILAFLQLPTVGAGAWPTGLLIAADVALYFIFYRLFGRIREREEPSSLQRMRNILAPLLGCVFVACGLLNREAGYLAGLPLLQFGLLFLVVIRSKADSGEADKRALDEGHGEPSRARSILKWVLRDPHRSRDEREWDRILAEQVGIFRWFNVISVVSLLPYFLSVFILSFSRFLSPLPITLLALGVLVGFANIVSLFSIKTRINFHFLYVFAVLVFGFIAEPHHVRTMAPGKAGGNAYGQRKGLAEFFKGWTEQRRAEIEGAEGYYPVFLIIADGGASRSGYWTASVLARIEDSTRGRFSRHVLCLSGASGGSVGNAAFHASLRMAAKVGGSQGHLDRCRAWLSNDFLSHTLARLLGPDLFKPLFPFDFIYDRAAALEKSLEQTTDGSGIDREMKGSFSESMVDSLPALLINATRMQDGRPALASTLRMDERVFGKRLDILNRMDPSKDVRLGTMTVLGARFPYLSPAGRLGNDYYVDGGYFDNSGAGAVHEMLIELKRVVDSTAQKDTSHWLRRIRFHVIHTRNSPLIEEPVKKVHPLVNDLFAPVKTLIGAYGTQTDVNNLRLRKYLQQINGGDSAYISFNLYRPDERDRYPMSWAISRFHLGALDARLDGHPKVRDFIGMMNRGDFGSLSGLREERP